jgi:hypothetical protein
MTWLGGIGGSLFLVSYITSLTTDGIHLGVGSESSELIVKMNPLPNCQAA